MPGLPNPYVLLGALVAAIALAIGAFLYGEHIQKNTDQVAVDRLKIEAANQLVAANTKTSDTEKHLAAVKDQAEQAYQAHAVAITDALLRNKELDAQVDDLKRHPSGVPAPGGVRLASGSGAGGSGKLPAAPQPPHLVVAGSPASLLPGSTRGDLIQLAYDADIAANYAGACHQYITQVTSLLKGSTP